MTKELWALSILILCVLVPVILGIVANRICGKPMEEEEPWDQPCRWSDRCPGCDLCNQDPGEL